MKILATVLSVVLAQDEGGDRSDDRWNYYDYSVDERVGHAVSGVAGGHEGNRRYCHSTADDQRIYRWDITLNGFFAHYNPVECLGEEQYCFLEERAHFGQIHGIRAGCAQMMNHPQVTPDALLLSNTQLVQNNYNQEAARGQLFVNPPAIGVQIFYGLGGCLALPAQNGYDTDAADWSTSKWNNYYMGTNGGYGQNQCLRMQRDNSKANLLPIGVSVCRACCVATSSPYATQGTEWMCNFLTSGDGAGSPVIPDAAAFDCALANGSGCAYTSPGLTSCEICHKSMYPNFNMYHAASFSDSRNLFEISATADHFCVGNTCIPE